jgi:hypothetical protein
MMNKQLSNGDFSNGSDPFIVEHPPDVKQEGADAVQALVKRDNAYVRVWRVLVLGIILGVGGLVSTLTYRALRREETDDYKTSVSRKSMNCPEIHLTSTSYSLPAFPIMFLPSFSIVSSLC